MRPRVYSLLALVMAGALAYAWWSSARIGPGEDFPASPRAEGTPAVSTPSPTPEATTSRSGPPAAGRREGQASGRAVRPTGMRPAVASPPGPDSPSARAGDTPPPQRTADLGSEQAASRNEVSASTADAASELASMLVNNYRSESEDGKQKRQVAHDLLVGMGAIAVPALLQASKGADPGFAAEIQSIVGEIGEAAIPPLVDSLGDAEKDVQKAAVTAIETFGGEAVDAVPKLLEVANGNDIRLALQALQTAAEMGEAAIPALVKALADDDAGIRFNAVYALAEMGAGAKPALESLEGRLYDENEHVRNRAMIAVQRIERGG